MLPLHRQLRHGALEIRAVLRRSSDPPFFTSAVQLRCLDALPTNFISAPPRSFSTMGLLDNASPAVSKGIVVSVLLGMTAIFVAM
jgi:hypothetical protein